MSRRTIKVGLIGYGTIGTGVARILNESSETISRRLGASIELVKIADLDVKTDRGVPLASGVLTDKVDEVLNDPEIEVVIELIGGYEPARTFLLRAIEGGKHVVTANKALLAQHGDEIFPAVENQGLTIGFEGAVAGAIPIIRSIKEAFVANRLSTIEGIVNGTANYILSEMSDHGAQFEDALKEAQAKGFAEADPTFDIEGIDSAHKIAILTRLAYGAPVAIDDICIEGISKITQDDMVCAREFGYRIKLLGISKYDGTSVDVRVHPAMISKDHPMANINGVLNAVRVCDNFMEENILVGHGAGSLPTASAVVGDVVEICRNLICGNRGRVPTQSYQMDHVSAIPLKNIGDIESEYFLRFSVRDEPSVLSKIAGVLGGKGISIDSVIQRGRAKSGSAVPLVIMTHLSKESSIRDALTEIDRMDEVAEPSNLIRVEN